MRPEEERTGESALLLHCCANPSFDEQKLSTPHQGPRENTSLFSTPHLVHRNQTNAPATQAPKTSPAWRWPSMGAGGACFFPWKGTEDEGH